jgi:fucose 4-O-acetylase-like acetyltransferase
MEKKVTAPARPSAQPDIQIPAQPSQIVWIDYARLIGIWLVVYNHSGISEAMWQFFSVIVLQILIFLSGYLEKNNRTIKETAIHGVKTILVPYALLYALTYVYWFLMDFIFHVDIYTLEVHESSGPAWFTLVKPIIGMIRGQGYYDTEYSTMLAFPMWFMPALFFTRIYHAIIVKLTGDSMKRYLAAVGVVIAAVFVLEYIESRTVRIPFSVDSGLLLYPFFAFGNIVRRTGVLKNMNTRGAGNIVFHLIIAAMGFALIWLVVPYNGAADPNVFYYGNNVILYYLLCAVGIISILSISLLFTKPIPLCTMLSRGTLLIMAYHAVLIPYLNKIYVFFGLPYNHVVVIILSLVNLSFFIVPINITQRYFPILLGGRKTMA